jgi:succinate-acetate transporter protein
MLIIIKNDQENFSNQNQLISKYFLFFLIYKPICLMILLTSLEILQSLFPLLCVCFMLENRKDGQLSNTY